MIRVLTEYECTVCNQTYAQRKNAIECEARGMEGMHYEKSKEPVKVGDIVCMWQDYGWFDGDEKWVMNLTDENRKKMKLNFFYVVTAIDSDPNHPHEFRYHVFTNAMTGKQGHREGWTGAHHYRMRKPKVVPAFVIEDSKKLVGTPSRWLL